MFSRGGKRRQSTGPDFSSVTSREQAEALVARGELEKVWLMPLEFGGRDIPENVVYVPVGTAGIKRHVDLEIIQPLVAEGAVTSYVATPEYTGESFVPIALTIAAANPGAFTSTIKLWGEALNRA